MCICKYNKNLMEVILSINYKISFLPAWKILLGWVIVREIKKGWFLKIVEEITDFLLKVRRIISIKI